MDKLTPNEILKKLRNREITLDDISERDDFEQIYNFAIKTGVIEPVSVQTYGTEDTSTNGLQSNSYFIAKMFHDNLKEYIDNLMTTPLSENVTNADMVDGYHIWVGSQEDYDAITTKNSETIYIII